MSWSVSFLSKSKIWIHIQWWKRHFLQGQLGITIDVPSFQDIRDKKSISIYKAPPGLKEFPPSSSYNKNELTNLGWQKITIDKTMPRNNGISSIKPTASLQTLWCNSWAYWVCLCNCLNQKCFIFLHRTNKKLGTMTKTTWHWYGCWHHKLSRLKTLGSLGLHNWFSWQTRKIEIWSTVERDIDSSTSTKWYHQNKLFKSHMICLQQWMQNKKYLLNYAWYNVVILYQPWLYLHNWFHLQDIWNPMKSNSKGGRGPPCCLTPPILLDFTWFFIYLYTSLSFFHYYFIINIIKIMSNMNIFNLKSYPIIILVDIIFVFNMQSIFFL